MGYVLYWVFSWGTCDLTITTGSAGALCCSTNLDAIITISLLVVQLPNKVSQGIYLHKGQ